MLTFQVFATPTAGERLYWCTRPGR